MPKFEFKLTDFDKGARFRATPSTIRIEHHYRRKGVCPGWRNHQVMRLVSMLKCTIAELLAMCGEFDFKVADRSLSANRWPGPLSLHFYMLEAALLLKKEGSNKRRYRRLIRTEFLNPQETNGSPSHTG